jgi:hypothetical protein
LAHRSTDRQAQYLGWYRPEDAFPVLPSQGVFLMRKMSKKSKVAAVVASVALVAVGGGAAYAYWSTTGGGAGSAKISLGTSAVTLHATFDPGLAPGSANNKTVTYTADNPNSSSTTVKMESALVSVDSAHSSCDAAWFGATVPTLSVLVPAGTVLVPGTATIGVGTLSMVDLSGTNQDSCKGATVTLTLLSH